MEPESELTPDAPDATLKWLTWPVIVSAIVLYLLIYAVYGIAAWNWWFGPAAAGQFGDMFGFLNAVVSGIAMLGVIVAILLQRQQNQMQSIELGLQRRELTETRKELAGQRQAQEALNAHAALQAEAAVDALRRQTADYIQRNKPVVFCDRLNTGYYVIRNVGGGFAINAYILTDSEVELPPITLGSLAADVERQLPEEVGLWLEQAGLRGARFLIIAEGAFSRTTQWTPTLNYRTPDDIRGGQVEHRFPEVKVPPPRGTAQPLGEFLNNNLSDLLDELAHFG